MEPRTKTANLGGHICGEEDGIFNLVNFRAVRKASLVGIVSQTFNIHHCVVVATTVVAARSIVIMVIAVELSQISGTFVTVKSGTSRSERDKCLAR